MNLKIQDILQQINYSIEKLHYGEQPQELYQPIEYIMALGGKRMRPLLVILGYSLFKDDWQKILTPALAVEVFHNFTLMHDDIMDNAPLRRGKATVHEKWDENIAILSGDVMLVNAYELLSGISPEKLPLVIKKFNRCAAEVCEGQQWDMNFEQSSVVSQEEYINMIRLKTAVLLGFSLELGAILADTSQQNTQLLKQFGDYIGIGFQLKDDLLDVYGDQAKFGKQVGGDIVANKKTFLLINALQKAEGKQAEELKFWLNATSFDKEEKVNAVKDIYNQLDIRKITEQKICDYFNEAFGFLEKIEANPDKKLTLEKFTRDLIERES